MNRSLSVLAALALATSSLAAATTAPAAPATIVSIQVDKPQYTMAGGIGASWHAIRAMPDFKAPGYKSYKVEVRHTAAQGSAAAGNPPLNAAAAWADIERHASWLGMDFMRIEFDRRMYEPEKGRFDWQNEEIQTLFRILDYCQSHQVDVFLTEMWRDVAWLSLPDVHPLISAPNSLDDHSHGLATLLEYLVKERKYTCIKWLNIANEPPEAGVWGYWWCQKTEAERVPLAKALLAVRKALDSRGIQVPLSGPGLAGVPKFDDVALKALGEMEPTLGAIDLHCYGGGNGTMLNKIVPWAQWAHAKGKPFFMTEMGDMGLGWGGSKAQPASFPAALSVGMMVLNGMGVGVDGFNRWSFLNRGDLDGQWQLLRTWDIQEKKYYEHVEPEPMAYYGFAMLTRFTAKHSKILPCTITQGGKELTANLRGFNLAALKSPGGALTVMIISREKAPRQVTFRLAGLERETPLFRYQLTEERIAKAGFQFGPDESVKVSSQSAEISMTLPPQSMTVLTSFDLKADAPGVTAE